MIQTLRKAKGWSQTELAQRSGLSRQLLSLIENGHGNCTITTIDVLARALGTHFILILTDDLTGVENAVSAYRAERQKIVSADKL